MTTDELKKAITDLANEELDKGKVTAHRLWLAVVRRHDCKAVSDTDGIAYCLGVLRGLAAVPLRDYKRPLPDGFQEAAEANPDMNSVVEYADELDVVFIRPWKVTDAEWEKAEDTIDRAVAELQAERDFIGKIRSLMKPGETVGDLLERHPEFEAQCIKVLGPPETAKPVPLKLGKRWKS